MACRGLHGWVFSFCFLFTPLDRWYWWLKDLSRHLCFMAGFGTRYGDILLSCWSMESRYSRSLNSVVGLMLSGCRLSVWPGGRTDERQMHSWGMLAQRAATYRDYVGLYQLRTEFHVVQNLHSMKKWIVTTIPTSEYLSFPCEYKVFPSHISYTQLLYTSIYDLQCTMISIMCQTSQSEGVSFILKSGSLPFPVEPWF